ncbi:MAG: phage virion morphogenesis protein [Candidatus Kapabacteria bacterium]|nr:phage virion morphogenesis protein [Candidatus Kapabacteria bacterium]
MTYAAIHQYGGNITLYIPITSKMRKFFWAKYYNTGLVNWKAMALTKKKELKPTIRIPARPYITLTKDDLEEIISLLNNLL